MSYPNWVGFIVPGAAESIFSMDETSVNPKICHLYQRYLGENSGVFGLLISISVVEDNRS